LWCSAAVGCQAAAAHLLPSVGTTAVVLAIHLLLRPLGRLVDRAPTGGGDDIRTYLLTVDVRRKHEPHLRAQLLQALTDADVRLHGLTSHASDDDSPITLHAELLIDGADTAHLDSLVTRLSIEPGVRTVAWQDRAPD
jgi:putative Mg2+ transporter-C (MgtC) family protein